MENTETKTKKQRTVPAVTVIRTCIQILSFAIMPGLFISIFSAIGDIYKAIIGGSFNIQEYSPQIILTAAVFIVTFIWGRFFCGFICAFGSMQDLLWLGGRHIPKKIKLSEKTDRILKYLKYAVLLFVVIGVWTFSVTGDTVWSPWTVFGMYATFMGFSTTQYLFTIGGLLLLLIIIGSIFIERFFCKYLCPLGALYSIASKLRIFKIKKPSASCGNCRLCSNKCSMSIPMNKYDAITSGECINCMRCTAVCHRENVNSDIIPSVSGTAAAAALMGVYFIGTLPQPATQALSKTTENDTNTETSQVSEDEERGQYKDGTYQGSGEGFRGSVNLTVTVSGGYITDITVESSKDDMEFLSKAESKIIPSIISAQSVNVDTVSGATFSSKGIISAVEDALGDQILINDIEEFSKDDPVIEQSDESEEESDIPGTSEKPKYSHYYEDEESSENDFLKPESSEEPSASPEFSDGVYNGTGIGFRGTTNVTVTVSGGIITDITINSYQDDTKFFERAAGIIVSSVLENQNPNVDTVSGATFSSNGLIEAISDALGTEFTNPNSTMGGGHHRH